MRRRLALLACAAGIGLPCDAADYAIDPTHTFVYFEAAHFGTSTSRGRFERKQGAIEFDRTGRSGRVEISFETASVSTGIPALDRRLCAPDLLDCATHPRAVFSAERFKFEGDRLSAVAGSLALRGRTLPFTLEASRFNCYPNLLLLREICGGDFEATLGLDEWGIAVGSVVGVPDGVRLRVQVEAIRQ